jgi:hypothetical protein
MTRVGMAADNPVSAAIVPEADLLVRFDMAKFMKSPIFKAMTEKMDKTDNDSLIKKHLGLAEEDFVSYVGTVVTAPMYQWRLAGAPQWDQLSAAMTFVIAKPVTMKQMKTFLDAAEEEGNIDEYVELTIAGRKVLHIPSASGGEPPVYIALSGSGQAVYVSGTHQGMTDLIGRATGSIPVVLSGALNDLRNAMPVGMQLAYFYSVPDALRTKLTEASTTAAQAGGAAMNPMANMGIGLLKMFENLRSVALGVGATEIVKVRLNADLGAEPQAQQTAMMIKNSLIPMLQMQLANMTEPGKPMIDANSVMSVANRGSVMELNLNVTQDLIQSIQDILMGAMMGGMMGGEEVMMSDAADYEIKMDLTEEEPVEEIDF